MRIKPLLTLAFALLFVAAAMAVKPGEWTHRTESDFADAETEDTVVTNLGEVQLARATEQLAELNGEDSVTYDIARLTGDSSDRTFLAVGPEGKLLRWDGEAVELLAEYENAQVFTLAAGEAGLWVGVSGAASRLELRSGPEMEVERTIELPDARYVWDVLVDGDRLWVATGTGGRVYAIDTTGDAAEPAVALETQQDNVLCLGMDGEGRVYAGTDGEGLIYRITRNGDDYETFAVYDADEPEIGALLVEEDGTIYAGTADAEQARPGRLTEAVAEARGRVERPTEAEIDAPEIPNVPPEPEPQADVEEMEDDADTDADIEEEDAEAEAGDEPEPSEDPTSTPSSEPATQPSAEQYDQLREAVRDRLAEARESGAMELQVSDRSGDSPTPPAARRSRGSSGRSPGSRPSREGNAIYRIDPEGFVSEVFRESVMILRLVKADRYLLAATGNEGQVYRINPNTNEVTILADLDPRQVPAMFDLGGGDVLLGTANPGRAIRLSNRYAAAGTLTSDPLDAGQISRWGKLRVTARAPEDTSVEVQTRSGNVADPDLGSWSDWSEPQEATLTGGTGAYMDVPSPTARFLQYRVRLISGGEATPAVNGLSLKYLMPNLRPQVTSITTEYAEASGNAGGRNEDAPQPRTAMNVEWEASDANEDELTYTLAARPFDEEGPFITIAEDLDEDNYEWDTRTVADGRYVLRVTASDAPDNIPGQTLIRSRRSDPVIIDNTPPDLQEVSVEQDNGGAVQLTAQAVDDMSPIAEVRYNTNSDKEWQFVLPEDSIYDSTEESIAVTITGLTAGTHVVTVRATDTLGNSRYVSRNITIEPGARRRVEIDRPRQ